MAGIVGDLLDLFPDTVVVEPAPAPDVYGASSFGPPQSVRARVTGKTTVVRGADGQERVSKVTCYLAGAFGVTTRDRFTLPPRFTPQQPAAIAVDQATDESGPHHETVFF